MLLSNLFKNELKSHGLYFGYNLGVAFFGGISPLLLATVSRHIGSQDAIELFYVLIIILLFYLFFINNNGCKDDYI